MDVDVMERHLAHVVQPGDHHAGHPERDDVAAGDQHAGRVVVGQLRRLLRPAERRVRPQGGAEPGVEHVGILFQRVLRPQGVRRQVVQGADQPLAVFLVAAARPRRCGRRTLASSSASGQRDVPDRNAMAPPQLPADAPVALLAEPVEIRLGIALREELHPAVVHRIHGRLRSQAAVAVASSRTTGPTGTARWASCCGRCTSAGCRGPRGPRTSRASPCPRSPPRAPCSGPGRRTGRRCR